MSLDHSWPGSPPAKIFTIRHRNQRGEANVQISDTVIPAFVNGSKRLLIGGNWQHAASGKEFDAINPATGNAIAHIAHGDAADIDTSR